MNCRVDEAAAEVNLELTDVPVLEKDLDSGSPSEYFYCLKTNPTDCDEGDLKSTTNGRKNGGISNRTGEATQTITFPRLCGDGDNKLKENCKDKGADWFHAGKTYRVTIFEKKNPESPVIRDAAFYVSHFYPKVTVKASTNLSYDSVKNGSSTITVELQGRKNKKTGNEANKFNDYWVRIEGFDNSYKTPAKCLYVSPDGNGAATIKLEKDFKDPNGNIIAELSAGKYYVKIKEGKEAKNNFQTCEEDEFTYYFVPFIIGQGATPGKFEKEIPDPFGKERAAENARTKPQPVCADIDRDSNGLCTKIPTGLGIKISTEPQLFVRDLFTIVLSIGGIAAIVFFIQAGYTLMNSAGNKEKVGAAREQITAAIMGLIFIILSIAILEFIGIDILHIPGFTR